MEEFDAEKAVELYQEQHDEVPTAPVPATGPMSTRLSITSLTSPMRATNFFGGEGTGHGGGGAEGHLSR